MINVRSCLSCVPSDTKTILSSTTSTQQSFSRNYFYNPHVIVMVGLPARGKTYMSKKLSRYLNWIGIHTKVFNLEEYRWCATTSCKGHEFFRADNAEAMEIRTQCVIKALEDINQWLANKGEVAVLDATNSTIDRRNMIQEMVEKMGYKLFFVESICNDSKIVKQNILKVKINNLDYATMNNDEVLADFLERIKHYKDKYEPLDEKKEKRLSYMKIYNAGRKVLVHKHTGHLQARIVYYLMSINIKPKTVYLTRHGESKQNLEGRIGGNSTLSTRGVQFAAALADYIKDQKTEKLRVWTSWLQRTIDTVVDIPASQERWRALNEINAGVCDEMTYEEIKRKYPSNFAARDLNKFIYRYPKGESYEDLIARLEPVIMELERQKCVLVVSHQAVLRCILGYFLGKSCEELPYLYVPLHTIIKLTPLGYGYRMEYVELAIEAVDTHRPNPNIFE